MVVYDLLNFIFFFSIDKVRGRCREVVIKEKRGRLDRFSRFSEGGVGK